MAGSVQHDDGGHAGHSRRHWTYWIAPHRSTKLTAPTLTHKGSGGCKSWITIETTTVARFSSLRSMYTTSSKHRSRPPSAILSSRVAIGVSKLCSFAYREAHSEPILSTSRELARSSAGPHAETSADGVVVLGTSSMPNALTVLRYRRASAPDRFRAISA